MVRIEGYGLNPILYRVVRVDTGYIVRAGFISHAAAKAWCITFGYPVVGG
jgi:hypothetical protein